MENLHQFSTGEQLFLNLGYIIIHLTYNLMLLTDVTTHQSIIYFVIVHTVSL